MKGLGFIISVLVLLLFGSDVKAGTENRMTNELPEISQTKANVSNLDRAFSRVASLPDFQTLTQEQIKNVYKGDWGKAKGVVYGNAEPRKKVLDILKDIPYKLLYSVSVDESNRIYRCYIEKAPNGEMQMLLAIVGINGNDLVVTHFSGKDISVYQEAGNQLKETTFDEMVQSVNASNAYFPRKVGEAMEILSMSINRQYWTVNVKLNTFGNGLADIMGSDSKKSAVAMLKSVSMKEISSIFNLDVGFKIVITTDSGERRTIILEPTELAEILNDTDQSPLQALELYVKNTKSSLPLDMHNGMSVADMYLENGMVVAVYGVDESIHSIARLNSVKATIRQNLANIVSQKQDLTMVQLSELIVSANYGITYMYLGNTSRQYVAVTFTCDELRSLLNK